MKYGYILFDLDGTLTDSGPGIMNCFRYAFEKMGCEVPPDLRRFVGPPLEDSFGKECGMSESDTVKAIAFYRERYFDKGIYENTVYDGIEEMLERLSSAGCNLAVSTSKNQRGADIVLEHFGLRKFFKSVCGSDAANGIVTKTDVIKHTIEDLGSPDKASVLMIGDRNYDVTGAHEAGIACMGVLWGYGSRNEFSEAGAEFITATPDEAAELILNIG